MIMDVKLQSKQVKLLIRRFSIQIFLDFLGFMIACFMLRGLWFPLSDFLFKIIFPWKKSTQNLNSQRIHGEYSGNRMVVGFVLVAKVLIRLSWLWVWFYVQEGVKLNWTDISPKIYISLGDDVDDDEHESCEIYQSNYNTRNIAQNKEKRWIYLLGLLCVGNLVWFLFVILVDQPVSRTKEHTKCIMVLTHSSSYLNAPQSCFNAQRKSFGNPSVVWLNIHTNFTFLFTFLLV